MFKMTELHMKGFSPVQSLQVHGIMKKWTIVCDPQKERNLWIGANMNLAQEVVQMVDCKSKESLECRAVTRARRVGHRNVESAKASSGELG